MDKKSKATDPLLVPVQRLAKMLAISVSRVHQLAQEGILPRAKPGRWDVEVVVPLFLRWHEKQIIKAGPAAEERQQRIRKMKLAADELEQKLRVRRGELLEKDEFGHAWNQGTTNIRTSVLAVPKKLAPFMAAVRTAREAEKEMREALNECLTGLANNLFGSQATARPKRRRVGRRKQDVKSGGKRRTRKVENR